MSKMTSIAFLIVFFFLFDRVDRSKTIAPGLRPRYIEPVLATTVTKGFAGALYRIVVTEAAYDQVALFFVGEWLGVGSWGCPAASGPCFKTESRNTFFNGVHVKAPFASPSKWPLVVVNSQIWQTCPYFP